MPRILLTNDDGVHSEGILALADALKPLGEVTIVAPVLEASAIGHALTPKWRKSDRPRAGPGLQSRPRFGT